MIKDDYYYLEQCIMLSQRAVAKGNPAVGALLVLNHEIMVEAEEATKSKMDITAHAELEVIRIAAKRLHTNDLSNYILYTTHEPCVMCAYAIRFHRIKKVVFLHTVPFLGGVFSSLPMLTTDEVPPHWGAPPEIIYLVR